MIDGMEVAWSNPSPVPPLSDDDVDHSPLLTEDDTIVHDTSCCVTDTESECESDEGDRDIESGASAAADAGTQKDGANGRGGSSAVSRLLCHSVVTCLLLSAVIVSVGLVELRSHWRQHLSSLSPFASSTPLFRAWPAAGPITRNSTCAAQLSSPVLANWLGLQLPSEVDVSELDVQSVIAQLRSRRRQTTLDIRKRQLDSALQMWLASSTAALPDQLLQRLRSDMYITVRVDRQLNPNSASTGSTDNTDAAFWHSLAPLLRFNFSADQRDVTTLPLDNLIPQRQLQSTSEDELHVSLSSRSPVLLAVPRLDEPYADYLLSAAAALSADTSSVDPFDSLASYFGDESVRDDSSHNLHGTASRLITLASSRSDTQPPLSRPPVVYSDLSAPACAVVFVPHVRPRTSDTYPRWVDCGHGPDSLIVSLVDDGFGFGRALSFEPVAHSDLSYPASLSELPFPLSLTSDAWQRDLNESGVLEAYEVEVVYFVSVPVVWRLADSTGVNTSVPVTIRITVRVQPGIAVDFGWGVYASDVLVPSLSPSLPPSSSSDAVNSSLLHLEGYVDYRSYEWNTDAHNQRLPRESLPIHFARHYAFLPSTQQGSSKMDEGSNMTVSDEAVIPPSPVLPFCTAADESGYWAAHDSPLVNTGRLSWDDMSSLPKSTRGMSFFGQRCVYRPVGWQEALSCLAARYPVVHWYGDSNSRRDIRTLFTAGRWLDEKYTCEDWTDTVVAGNVTDTNASWPYPNPVDSPVMIGGYAIQVRLPRQPGEQLSINATTGAQLDFKFVAGLSGNKRMPSDFFDSGPADLVVLGVGSWEPMVFQWDHATDPHFDMRRFNDWEYNAHNLTRNLLDAATRIHNTYVVPNPHVTIVLRTSPPMAEHATVVDHRRYSHQRMESFKRRIVRVLRSSVIGERLKVWDVQQLFSYKLHSLPSDDGAELCDNGHVGPVTIRTELNVLFNALCPVT